MSQFNAGKDICDAGLQLRDRYGIKGSFASDKYWDLNFYLAYYLHGTYYGESNGKYDCFLLSGELAKRHIDYFFSWDEPLEAQCIFLSKTPPDKRIFLPNIVLEGFRHRLTIYKLTK